MKFQDVRSAYQDHSAKASEIVRQLGFAGIAVIWLFRSEVGGKPVINSALLPAGLLVIVALACDLLQYVAGSLIWGAYGRKLEREGRSEDQVFSANPRLNWPALTFFWTKILCIVFAYLILGRFVANTIAGV